MAQLKDYESSDLPERTKAALRCADKLADRTSDDEELYADLHRHFSDDQILDLGMTIAFMFGWQRFIEAFGIVPDRWTEGSSAPWNLGEDV